MEEYNRINDGTNPTKGIVMWSRLFSDTVRHRDRLKKPDEDTMTAVAGALDAVKLSITMNCAQSCRRSRYMNFLSTSILIELNGDTTRCMEKVGKVPSLSIRTKFNHFLYPLCYLCQCPPVEQLELSRKTHS